MKKHGGKRDGAGRKFASDPKIQVSVYLLQSVVTLHGGIDAVKKEIKTKYSK